MKRYPTILLATCLGISTTAARAHFRLNAPASLSTQSAFGDPQKTAPCGQDDGSPAFVPTSAITTVQTGSMLTITIDEKVPHPGHYRVSLAQDMAALPDDPIVSPGGGFDCGSTPINASPTLPLLADGLFVHTQSFSGPQTTQVQLPSGMTCTNCVLQVTEFMADHGAPCYYHHCATITIADNAPQGDAGVNPGDDAGTTNPPGGGGGGGGCSTQPASGGVAGLFAFAAAALLIVRRRRS